MRMRLETHNDATLHSLVCYARVLVKLRDHTGIHASLNQEEARSRLRSYRSSWYLTRPTLVIGMEEAKHISSPSSGPKTKGKDSCQELQNMVRMKPTTVGLSCSNDRVRLVPYREMPAIAVYILTRYINCESASLYPPRYGS